MGVVSLMGWDADTKEWRKVLVNAAGKLIIDPSEIFEDPPTDGEAGKAPTSNWAHDHAADADAHHTKFTITEHDTATRHPLANLDTLVCSEAEADSKISTHNTLAGAHCVSSSTGAIVQGVATVILTSSGAGIWHIVCYMGGRDYPTQASAIAIHDGAYFNLSNYDHGSQLTITTTAGNNVYVTQNCGATDAVLYTIQRLK